MVVSSIGGLSTGSLSYKMTWATEMPKCFGHARHRKEVRDNLINMLKLLANKQKDGDSQVRMIVPGLPKKSRRKSMDGLRSFVAVDNYAAVKIGDLERERGPRKW